MPPRLRGVRCPAGHRFDAARQGYVNLLVGRPSKFTPDTAEMIMARERVQSGGVFSPLTAALRGLLAGTEPAVFLDCGAGTGYYLHDLLAQRPESQGIALDLSPAGLKRAAKHPRSTALAWDLWQPLPLADDGVDVLLNVFAPRNPEEYARVLRPGGVAVVVIPGPGHLAELAQRGLLKQQQDKREQVVAQMRPHFGPPEENVHLQHTRPVSVQEAADLIFMGPAGHHGTLAAIREEIDSHEELTQVSLELDILLWRKQPLGEHPPNG
ncbi:methyltransferase domain-containing protein [Nesterenkonia flava]